MGGGGEVQYYDELPQIHPLDEDKLKHVKQVYSKEKKWEFEIEYRTHKFWPHPATKEQRLIKVPVDAYAEIIFGYAIPREYISEIKKMSERNGLKLSFRQARRNGESIEIVDHIK